MTAAYIGIGSGVSHSAHDDHPRPLEINRLLGDGGL
jgi:hypothetical protein